MTNIKISDLPLYEQIRAVYCILCNGKFSNGCLNKLTKNHQLYNIIVNDFCKNHYNSLTHTLQREVSLIKFLMENDIHHLDEIDENVATLLNLTVFK